MHRPTHIEGRTTSPEIKGDESCIPYILCKTSHTYLLFDEEEQIIPQKDEKYGYHKRETDNGDLSGTHQERWKWVGNDPDWPAKRI